MAQRHGFATLHRVWFVVVCALALLPLLFTAAHGQPSASPEHPAIAEILAMLDADVGDEVILARIDQLSDVPSLSGETIANLKRRGASDRVLLALVGAPNGPRSQAASSSLEPRLRVVLASDFPVTRYAVVLDGLDVAARGDCPEGESEPGRILTPTRRLRLEPPAVVYDAAVSPGTHTVAVEFAVTRVYADPDDVWMEYSRQRYVSAGVQRRGAPPRVGFSPSDETACTVAANQTCEVVVHFDRRPETRLGGSSVYGVAYDVAVSAAEAAPRE